MEQLLQKSKPLFFASWFSLNVLFTLALFGCVPKIHHLYLVVVLGSIIIFKLRQFAGKEESQLTVPDLNLAEKVNQLQQFIVTLIASLTKDRKLQQNIELGVILFIVSLLLKRTYLFAILLVLLNKQFASIFLNTIGIDVNAIFESLQELAESKARLILKKIPKYQANTI